MNTKGKKLIVAIDGPSGAGKSTVSRKVAEKLGYTYIDTGAMYRCVGLVATRENLACEQSVALDDVLDNLVVSFSGPATSQRVFIGGEEVTALIREHEVSNAASRFSTLAPVRAKLVALQRKMGAAGGIVMEGRDIGTNVFPEAEVKIYLDASAEERARRRHDELDAKGESPGYRQILEDQKKRDDNDRTRKLNPLIIADDALHVDTTGVGIDQVVDTICNIVKKKH